LNLRISAIVPMMMLIAACATMPGRSNMDGVEVSVAFDRAGENGAFAEGVADPATGRLVTPDDPVRIASVSKLVVAIGVMPLVEAGKLDLDRDVSGWLGWPMRNPAFPDRPVTLRMLLSHTSSVRDHDDQYAIPLGGSLRAVMADPNSWDSRHGPGDGYFTYGNLNFPIVGSIIERVTGERFDIWMRREVLDPMRIDACYNWPTCSDAAVARAVVLTQDGSPIRDDLGGKRPDCPVFAKEGDSCDLTRWKPGENGALFSPQGGLRISARGLARVGRMLLNDGVLDGVSILSPQSVEALLTPVWTFNGSNGDTDHGFYCRYGLATQTLATRADGCGDDPAGDGIARLGHSGDAYGVRSGVWIDRTTGTGIAYLVTGLPEVQPPGQSAFRAAEEAAFRRSLNLQPR
jgi:CubicO group peptidase (beta-lactamase class C family)